MQDIHPIKPVIQTPIFTQNQILAFWVFVGVVLIVLFVLLAYYFWKKRQKKQETVEVTEEEIKIDYEAQAKNKLKKIQKLIDNEKYKQFYLDVTEIIKEYIDGMHNLNIADLTTKEIVNHTNISNSIKKELQDFFTDLDFAKFTNHNLNKERAEKIHKRAFKIIK